MGLLARVGHIMEQLGQIQWKYSDPTHRIRSNVVSATCHQERGATNVGTFERRATTKTGTLAPFLRVAAKIGPYFVLVLAHGPAMRCAFGIA
ncbi:MAG: hypothetical protein WA419_00570 [Silvibacterium sp.]